MHAIVYGLSVYWEDRRTPVFAEIIMVTMKREANMHPFLQDPVHTLPH